MTRDHVRKRPNLTQDDLVVVEDEDGRKHYRMEDGTPVCGRLKKEKNREIPDEACLGPPMANGACRIHGGKAGRPIEHGRYSRTLKKMKKRFEVALSDKDLLDTRRELAMMDVLIERLAEKAEDLDCPSWRQDLQKTYQELSKAIRNQRQSEVGPLLSRLGDLISNGAGAAQVVEDLMGHVDKRANRAHAMNVLEVRKEEKVTVSELTSIFAAWVKLLEERLEPRVFFGLVPELRRLTLDHRRLEIEVDPQATEGPGLGEN